MASDSIDPPSVPPRRRGYASGPPAWGIAVTVAAFAFSWIAFFVIQSWPELLPFEDQRPVYVGLICLTPLVMLSAMLAKVLIDGRRAAKWQETMGTVTRSNVAVSHPELARNAEETHNVAAIDYSFTVNGIDYTGNRISITENPGDETIEGTLNRYPVGAVVKIYYNPADPTDCVLEREVPTKLLSGCGILLAVAIVGLVALFVGFDSLGAWLAARVPPGHVPLVIFSLVFAFALFIFFLAQRNMKREADRWTPVEGKIVSSGIRQFTDKIDNRRMTFFAPDIVYTYQVNGHEYTNGRIALNRKTAGSRSYAEKIAAKYPVDATVTVLHDPNDPVSAILENPKNTAWFLLAGAVAFIVVAAWLAGML